MALVNTVNGEYHKLEELGKDYRIMNKEIVLIAYADVDHRTEWDTKFKTKHEVVIALEDITVKWILMEYVNDPELSEDNNYKTALYEYLHWLDEYAGFENA